MHKPNFNMQRKAATMAAAKTLCREAATMAAEMELVFGLPHTTPVCIKRMFKMQRKAATMAADKTVCRKASTMAAKMEPKIYTCNGPLPCETLGGGLRDRAPFLDRNDIGGIRTNL